MSDHLCDLLEEHYRTIHATEATIPTAVSLPQCVVQEKRPRHGGSSDDDVHTVVHYCTNKGTVRVCDVGYHAPEGCAVRESAG